MGMKHKFIFGGLDSSDYSIWLTGEETFQAPERDVEYIQVPGRNGDLIIDNGRWENMSVTYPANIPNNFEQNMAMFRAAICRKRGYQRLEDTYHPDEFRLASFTDAIEPEMIPLNRGGEFDITFNCKPQRFLKSGEEPFQLLPPYMTSQTMSTNYIPVITGERCKIIVHCKPGETVVITVKFFSSDGTQTGTMYDEYTDGDNVSISYGSGAAYLRIQVEVFSDIDVPGDIDQVWLEINMNTIFNGEPLRIDAIFARTWYITNPTGYASKPLFEVYGQGMPSFTLKNYVDDVFTSWYDWRVFNTGVYHFYMDCDVQYVYDDDHNNLTNFLFLTTAQSGAGEGLVFPELGDGKIMIYSYSTVAPTIKEEADLGLVLIYPRWWRI